MKLFTEKYEPILSFTFRLIHRFVRTLHQTRESKAVFGILGDAGAGIDIQQQSFEIMNDPEGFIDRIDLRKKLGVLYGFHQESESVAAQIRDGIRFTDQFRQFGRDFLQQAIADLKQAIGEKAVISGMIPGPYTLLLLLVQPGRLFLEMKKQPEAVNQVLEQLSRFLGHVGQAYKQAGADFITIHDMGGSPAFLGPAKYEQFVFPAEQRLIAELPKPRVLSVCGATNQSMHLLAQTGADAISVDQLTNLAGARAILNATLLFGNIDPVATLWQGDQATITEAVHATREAGVDAVWPGCDLVPQTPIQNMRAWVGQ